MKMKKDYWLGILFFSALWGASEAVLGGALYRAHISHSSVPLTIIAFIILSIARVYLPQKGSSTLIASVAMLYKFLNAPFFACHLLAIFLLGFSYDLVFSLFKVKSRALFGLAATYLGYILFALTITYVFRYHYWIEEGLSRILRYVGISGTMAGFGNAIFVPVSLYLAQAFREKAGNPFKLSELSVWNRRGSVYQTRNGGCHKGRLYNYLKPGLLTGSICLITVGLWILGITRCF
jgi:hypothetical protein